MQIIITGSSYFKREAKIMSKIKCSVTECQYNRDVMCDAPMIQVNHSGVRHSSESEETQCDTFKPKSR